MRRVIISERQAGVAERGESEVRLPPNAREASVHRLTERCEVASAAVGPVFPFDVALHLFARVQLPCVPGQPFDRQPGARSSHVGLHGPTLVGAKPVPEEQHAPAPKWSAQQAEREANLVQIGNPGSCHLRFRMPRRRFRGAKLDFPRLTIFRGKLVFWLARSAGNA
jgi:hypothetical protein